MHKHLSIFIAVATVTSSLVAQNNLSDFLNMGVTFTSRNGANNVPATIYTRIDKESYAGWGVDAAQPGMRVFSGLRFNVQDQDLATQDTWQLTAYTESTTPDTPDTTAPIATTGNFVLPVGTGIGAYLATANFVTPIAAPGFGRRVRRRQHDARLERWHDRRPFDLGHVGRSRLGTARRTRLRRADARPGNTHSGHYQPVANTHAFAVTRQSHIEPIIATPAGVCSALHNADPVHANANTSPGTTCMHSALSPDSQSPPRTAGRADDVGMTFRHVGMPDGSLAIFLVDIAPAFGTEFPLSLFLPGSVGTMCVNQASVQSVAIGFTSGGSASNVITFSPATRTYIAGVPLIHQVVTIDALTGTAYAGPCSKQTL
jgi:hypothetical protein